MFNESINSYLNEQINKEFYSGYLYLSMSGYFYKEGCCGFAHWTKGKAQEKIESGLKIFDYILERGGQVELKQIKAPEKDFNGHLDTLEKMYINEYESLKSIIEIYKNIDAYEDRATLIFLDKSIKKQTELKDSIRRLIDKVKKYGDDYISIMLINKELHG